MDTALVRELYERYGHHVYGRCVYLLRDADEARDAMQEVFVKVLGAIDEFRKEASPATWIIRIATNHCLNLNRSRKAAWRERFVREQKARPGLDESADGVEKRQLVLSLLDGHDAETQAVAVHYFVDEMTQEEIAAAVGRSLPTVRKRLQAFLESARAALAAQDVKARAV